MSKTQQAIIDFFATLNVLVYGVLFVLSFSAIAWHDPRAVTRIVQASLGSSGVDSQPMVQRVPRLQLDFVSVTSVQPAPQCAGRQMPSGLCQLASAFYSAQWNAGIVLNSLGRNASAASETLSRVWTASKGRLDAVLQKLTGRQLAAVISELRYARIGQ